MDYDGPIITRAQAKALGLKRYFTGKLCPKGHVAQRVTVNGTCRICSNAMSDAAHKARPEKPRANSARWRKANREKHNAWGKDNPEARKVIANRWSRLNGDKRRAYYEANAEAERERTRIWIKNNPEKARALGRNYRARAANAEGAHTAAETRNLFKRQRGKCAYCTTNLQGKYHADHIVPLVKGGSNWIGNIQLTCPKCNMRKNGADPIDFAKRLGKLI